MKPNTNLVIYFLLICNGLFHLHSVRGQANFITDPPYFGQKYTNVAGARALLLDDAGDILVLSRGDTNIQAIFDTPAADGSSVDVCKVVILNGTGLGLNHGIAYSEGYLYASSGNPTSNVFRWPYQPGQRTLITAPQETVISGIPAGGHQTRTIIFDAAKRLYVSIGSAGNVDNDSIRSRIRRFDLDAQPFPINWDTGEIFADGLRNEVGLAFDKAGYMWGVENGADRLERPDIEPNLFEGNPAEELNRFPPDDIGGHYGYPYCFTAHTMSNYNAGTQFAWPTFMDDGLHTDAWCRNISNNRNAVFPMPSHNAPLGIEFFDGRNCSDGAGAFSCEAQDDAFIAFHGSGGGQGAPTKSGYSVQRFIYNKLSLYPTGQTVDIIYESDLASCNPCFRPVNAIFDKEGHLIVSADTTGEIFRVYYNMTPPAVNQNCAIIHD